MPFTVPCQMTGADFGARVEHNIETELPVSSKAVNEHPLYWTAQARVGGCCGWGRGGSLARSPSSPHCTPYGCTVTDHAPSDRTCSKDTAQGDPLDHGFVGCLTPRVGLSPPQVLSTGIHQGRTAGVKLCSQRG